MVEVENDNPIKMVSVKQAKFISTLLKRKPDYELQKPLCDLSSAEAGTVIDYLNNGVKRNKINALLRYKDPHEIPNLDGGHIYAEYL